MIIGSNTWFDSRMINMIMRGNGLPLIILSKNGQHHYKSRMKFTVCYYEQIYYKMKQCAPFRLESRARRDPNDRRKNKNRQFPNPLSIKQLRIVAPSLNRSLVFSSTSVSTTSEQSSHGQNKSNTIFQCGSLNFNNVQIHCEKQKLANISAQCVQRRKVDDTKYNTLSTLLTAVLKETLPCQNR